ncbi:MAG: hypothetical protein ACREF7_04805, partial [Candidatus Saccharimonadales bacterium]
MELGNLIAYPHPVIIVTDKVDLVKKIDVQRAVIGISLLCDPAKIGESVINNLVEFDPILAHTNFQDFLQLSKYITQAQPLAAESSNLNSILAVSLWIIAHSQYNYSDLSNWLEAEQYDTLF